MEKNGLAEKTIVIPVDEWYGLSLDDTCVKVKIRITGHSMQPLIRRNRDFVTIQPLRRKALKGDIVLFRNVDGRYIVHRVRRVYDDGVQTMGDNRLSPDTKILEKDVLGLVTHIHRGSRTVFVDTRIWRLLGRLHMAAAPLRRAAAFVFGPLKRMLGRMVR